MWWQLNAALAPKWASNRTQAEVMAVERQLSAGWTSLKDGIFKKFGIHGEQRLLERVVYFLGRLVRINSFSCGSLCPAEKDKHDRSRSAIFPAGKTNRKAGDIRQRKQSHIHF